MAALNVASPTFQGPPGEYVFLANFFDFAYNYVLGIKKRGAILIQIFGDLPQKHTLLLFLFLQLGWDGSHIICCCSHRATKHQSHPQWWEFLLPFSAGRGDFAVSNSRRTGYVINWPANQWVTSATLPRLRTARLAMKRWRRKALVNWLKVPR